MASVNWAAVGACVTAGAVVIAVWHLWFLHREAKSQKTREMMRRFVSDPLLIEAIDHIYEESRKDRAGHPPDYSRLGDKSEKYVRQLLNALEEVGYGVVNKEMREDDIRKQFGKLVRNSVCLFIMGEDVEGKKARKVNSQRSMELQENLPCLMELFGRWFPERAKSAGQ